MPQGIRSKGCLSNKTALAMVFKLVDGAQKTRRKLDGHNQLPKIIQGVKFTDGLEVVVKPPPDPSGRHQEAAADRFIGDETGNALRHRTVNGPSSKRSIQGR